MKKRMLIHLAIGLLATTALAVSPFAGTGRADLWVGQNNTAILKKLSLLPNSPVGQVSQIAVGRIDVRQGPRTVAVQVFDPSKVDSRRVQILVNANALGANVSSAAGGLNVLREKVANMVKPIGRIDTWELLPAGETRAVDRVPIPSVPIPSVQSSTVQSGASTLPCGSILATLTLIDGIALEAALNALTALDPNVLMYPDPISGWGGPRNWVDSQASSALASKQVLAQAQPQPQVLLQPQVLPQLQSVVMPAMPVRPKPTSSFQYAFQGPTGGNNPYEGIGKPTSRAKGNGITIAVLDTGFGGAAPVPTPTEVLYALPPINAMIPLTTPNYAALAAQAADFWEGHGTEVAMLAAGSTNGVATKAKVLPVKVCAEGDFRASCNTTDVLRGICLAMAATPDPTKLVMNLSLGGSQPTQGIHAALNWASSMGVVVVTAGGNQGQNGNPREYPAAFMQASNAGSLSSLPILAVASVSRTRTRTLANQPSWFYSGFTTKGTYLNISAPGEFINIGQNYLYSGTSFSAPLVAGAAAILREKNPTASSAQIVQMMTSLAFTINTGVNGQVPMLDLTKY